MLNIESTIFETITGNTTTSLLSMQLLYIDPILQTYFFNHKSVSVSLGKSDIVVFLCLSQVLDNNRMEYFLFNLKAKKVSILFANSHYNFPFRHVKIRMLQCFLISLILKDYNKLMLHILTLSEQVQYGQNGFIPMKHRVACK